MENIHITFEFTAGMVFLAMITIAVGYALLWCLNELWPSSDATTSTCNKVIGGIGKVKKSGTEVGRMRGRLATTCKPASNTHLGGQPMDIGQDWLDINTMISESERLYGDLIKIKVIDGMNIKDIYIWDKEKVQDLFIMLESRLNRLKDTFSFQFNYKMFHCNEQSKSLRLREVGIYHGASIQILPKPTYGTQRCQGGLANRSIKTSNVEAFTGKFITINIIDGHDRKDIFICENETIDYLFIRLHFLLNRDKETLCFEFVDDLIYNSELNKSRKLRDIGLYDGATINILTKTTKTISCSFDEGTGPEISKVTVRNVTQRGVGGGGGWRGRGGGGRGRGGGGDGYRPYAASGQAPPPSAKQPPKTNT